MDKWDQQKLEEVVNKKHGSEKAKPKTEIVSYDASRSLMWWNDNNVKFG